MSLAAILASVGGLLAVVVAFFFVKKSAKGQGVAEGRLEGQQEVIRVTDEVNQKTAEQNAATVASLEQTHEIHDRLERDPDYAERVRDRFTRPPDSDQTAS